MNQLFYLSIDYLYFYKISDYLKSIVKYIQVFHIGLLYPMHHSQMMLLINQKN